MASHLGTFWDCTHQAEMWVFDPFHCMFGRGRRKEKKERKGKRERLLGIKHIFFALLDLPYVVIIQ